MCVFGEFATAPSTIIMMVITTQLVHLASVVVLPITIGSILGREKLNFVNYQTRERMINYSTLVDSSAPSPTICIKKTLRRYYFSKKN
jgi:hypothetical protein